MRGPSGNGRGGVPAESSRRVRRGRRALGLRGRVTATFAAGSLLVSASLALITYATARHYFLSQHEDTVVHQAYVNASLVRSALETPGANIPQVLASLDTIPVSFSVLENDGNWYETDISVGRDSIPPELRNLVTAGTPGNQTFDLSGVPQLAVGVPIPKVHAAYFEVFSLDELQRTLRTLALALAIAAAVTTVGGTIIGRWASDRTLRPLHAVSRAAVSIAGGHLDTRMEVPDDTELAALAESFNVMASNLQQRIEREARFTSDVNHELRSPLTTLMTSIGVLEARKEELPERSQRALDLVASEVTRFHKMVTDLLEISRFDAGAATLSLDEVAVGDLVRNAVAPDQGIPLTVSPAVNARRVRVDKRRIERVIANLVENATAYGGGVSKLGVDAEGGHLRIVVEDEGPGIPETERQRVFDRFSRGSTSSHRRGGGGAGLGLSLVAEHVRLHGGRVWVEEGASGGARFVVDLPVGGR